MLLTLHIALAVLSLVVATFAMFIPSKNLLKATYAAGAGGLLSGVILGLTSHVNLIQACISGSLYLSFVLASTLVTRYRITTAQ